MAAAWRACGRIWPVRCPKRRHDNKCVAGGNFGTVRALCSHAEGSLARANVHGEPPACRKIFAPTRIGRSHSLRATCGSIASPTPSSCRRSRSPFLCSVVTQYGVKFLVDTLSQPAHSATGVVAGLRHPRRAHRRRQSPVAIGGLGRPLDVRGRDGRRAPRPLPPSHRACAELLRQPFPRHAHEPHHGDIQRALHRREHAGVERAAAVPGDGLRHRASSRP